MLDKKDEKTSVEQTQPALEINKIIQLIVDVSIKKNKTLGDAAKEFAESSMVFAKNYAKEKARDLIETAVEKAGMEELSNHEFSDQLINTSGTIVSHVRAYMAEKITEQQLVELIGESGIDDLLLTTDEEIAKVMAINVGGTANIIKHTLPVMEKQNAGNMVIISSIAARDGGPANQIYCASKAAVTSLIQSASKMAAPYGVRVNGILPGIIYTDMWDDILVGRAHNGDPNDTREVDEEEKARLWKEALEVIPLGRAQQPRDISWSTAFLASDFAREITGQCLCIDGGMTSGR